MYNKILSNMSENNFDCNFDCNEAINKLTYSDEISREDFELFFSKLFETELVLELNYGFETKKIDYNTSQHCDLCKCYITEGDYETRIPCGHKYHYECIIKMIMTHKSSQCPSCKNNREFSYKPNRSLIHSDIFNYNNHNNSQNNNVQYADQNSLFNDAYEDNYNTNYYIDSENDDDYGTINEFNDNDEQYNINEKNIDYFSEYGAFY